MLLDDSANRAVVQYTQTLFTRVVYIVQDSCVKLVVFWARSGASIATPARAVFLSIVLIVPSELREILKHEVVTSIFNARKIKFKT